MVQFGGANGPIFRKTNEFTRGVLSLVSGSIRSGNGAYNLRGTPSESPANTGITHISARNLMAGGQDMIDFKAPIVDFENRTTSTDSGLVIAQQQQLWVRDIKTQDILSYFTKLALRNDIARVRVSDPGTIG